MIIYVKPSCVASQATLRALDDKGVSYSVLNLTESYFAHEHTKALGYSMTPIVLTRDTHWSGFRPDKIDDYARRAA